MKKATIVWLVTATILVVVGTIILGGTMTMLGWDLKNLFTTNYETNLHDITAPYKHISIITNTAKVIVSPSGDASSSVVCREEPTLRHRVTVQGDTLVVEVVDTRSWYQHIGIFYGDPAITLQLPEGAYGTLSIRTNTGDITIPHQFRFERMDIQQRTGSVKTTACVSGAVNIQATTGSIDVHRITAGSLDLSVSTGRVTVADVVCEGDVNLHTTTGKTELADLTCRRLLSDGSTGDITLHTVTASESFSIERDTGDVRFEGADAADITVETDTGNVTGRLLTDKVFLTHSDTGKVDVPKTVAGGRCEITTDTGDIRLTVGTAVSA